MAWAAGAHRGWRLAAVACLLVCLAAFAAAKSRGALLGVLAGGAVWFWLLPGSLRARPRQRLAALAFIAVVLCMAWCSGGASRLVSGLTDPDGPDALSSRQRLQLWRVGLRAVADGPTVVGYGAGGVRAVLSARRPTGFAPILNSSLSQYVDSAVEHGALGVACLAGALLFAFVVVARQARSETCGAGPTGSCEALGTAALASAVVLVAVHGAFEALLRAPGLACLFWSTAGLGLGRAAMHPRPPRAASGPPGALRRSAVATRHGSAWQGGAKGAVALAAVVVLLPHLWLQASLFQGDLYCWTGLLAERSHHWDRAARLYARAQGFAPVAERAAIAGARLCLVEAKLGQRPDVAPAIDSVCRALARTPDDPENCWLLAVALEQRGSHRQALEFALRACQLEPANELYQDLAAVLEHRRLTLPSDVRSAHLACWVTRRGRSAPQGPDAQGRTGSPDESPQGVLVSASRDATCQRLCDGSTVLLDHNRGRYLGLDAFGTHVWRSLERDGPLATGPTGVRALPNTDRRGSEERAQLLLDLWANGMACPEPVSRDGRAPIVGGRLPG